MIVTGIGGGGRSHLGISGDPLSGGGGGVYISEESYKFKNNGLVDRYRRSNNNVGGRTCHHIHPQGGYRRRRGPTLQYFLSSSSHREAGSGISREEEGEGVFNYGGRV